MTEGGSGGKAADGVDFNAVQRIIELAPIIAHDLLQQLPVTGLLTPDLVSRLN